MIDTEHLAIPEWVQNLEYHWRMSGIRAVAVQTGRAWHRVWTDVENPPPSCWKCGDERFFNGDWTDERGRLWCGACYTRRDIAVDGS